MKFFTVSTNKIDYRWFWLTIGRFSIVVNRPRYCSRPRFTDWRKFSNQPGMDLVPCPLSFYLMWFAFHWQPR